MTWWKNVDWLNAIGQAVLTVAGPLGAPLKFLLEVRDDLNDQVNDAVSEVYAGTAPISSVGATLRRGREQAEPWVAELVEFCVDYTYRKIGTAKEVDPNEVHMRIAELLDGLRLELEQGANRLRDAMTEYIWEPDDIRVILTKSGIPLGKIKFSGTAEHIWFSVFQQLKGKSPIRTWLLVYEAHKEKPDVEAFSSWFE